MRRSCISLPRPNWLQKSGMESWGPSGVFSGTRVDRDDEEAAERGAGAVRSENEKWNIFEEDDALSAALLF